MAPQSVVVGPYRCSVVIPTKNGGELFRTVVRRLQTQTCWRDVEFIVIDSGSSDETISIARSAGATVFSIPPAAFSHGSTRDYGISLSNSGQVVLMVQDAIPQDDTMIERLLSGFEDERVAGVYARQIPQPTADVITKRNLNSWITGGLDRQIKSIESLDWYRTLSPMQKYRFCNFDNVCSAINKAAWKIEPFGPIKFGEDIAWAERVLKRGFKIVYEPAAAVVHSHCRSLLYEYKRTYLAHRLLFRLFGLRTVPSLRAFCWSWMRKSLSDTLFVARHEKQIRQKFITLLTTPALNLCSGIAQYRAVRDELHGISKNMENV